MTVLQQWQDAPPIPDHQLARLKRFEDLPRAIAQILFNRGLCNPEEIQQFFDYAYGDDNPFNMKGMNQAVTLLRQALRDGRAVAVYGDFDADGVTATAVLVEALRALGANVRPYIPHRVDEGYGLHVEALDELADQGVGVIVTVDCGIRAVEEVGHARRRGLEVIVTDHHSVGKTLPPASAIINPKQPGCTYPFKDLAGVGIAYKLAQALLRSHRKVPVTGQVSNLVEEDLLDLVALGTVADLAPLHGENRSLVWRGLARINEGSRPGLVSLIQRSGLRLGQVDAQAIGFGLGPRINAAGRLDDAGLAYRLLVAQYPGEADKLADELNELNRLRQQKTAEMQEIARGQALAQGKDVHLLFAVSPDFPEGIVGLAAGRLCEEFYRPAVVVHKGETTSRGSARSIPEFHITEALDQCRDLLVRHGGHAAAAGFTVENDNLPGLEKQLTVLAAEALSAAEARTGQELKPTLTIDYELGLAELNRDLHGWLARMEPFGYDNPVPVFMTRRLHVLGCRAVGAKQDHLKLHLTDGRVRQDAIAFRQAHWLDHLPTVVDVAYHLELNVWNGREQLQLNVCEMRPAE
jgi:single-stranded-DNA-specific exonuclease